MINGFSKRCGRVLTLLIIWTFLLQTVIPVQTAFATDIIHHQSSIPVTADSSLAGEIPSQNLPPRGQSPAAESPEEQTPVVAPESKVVLEKLPIQILPASCSLDTITINGQTAKVKAGELIVRYSEENILQQSRISLQAAETPDKGEPVGDGLSLVIAQPELGLEETLVQLRQNPDVVWAEPNYEFYALTDPNDPNDPMYKDQWGLKDISGVNAWDYGQSYLNTTQATPVKIAILDTGVDSSHEDLANRIGLGYNALTGSDLSEDDSVNSHGTHVAGIAAAVTGNETGIAGTAGNYPIEIMPVKVLDSAGVGSMLSVAQGIDWAVAHGAKVINLSLGARLPDYPQTLAKAVKDAQDAGVVVVAAAGNEGRSIEGFYPACLPGVISVGASGFDHKPATFSNYQTTLYAPGVKIHSTLKNNTYGEMNGTSAAAPFVSGTAALLRSVSADKKLFEYTKALQNGYTRYGYSYPYSYVFNAQKALSNLLFPSGTGSNAEIIQPADDGYVSGTVKLAVKVFNPSQVSKLEFVLYDESNHESDYTGTILHTFESFPESGIIELDWDSTSVPDGRYTVELKWYDLDYEDYYGGQVTLVVANDNSAGLTLQIKKPDGTAAAGAKVWAFHAIKDSNTGKYQLQREPSYNNFVYKGTADLQGRVILPAIDAISGNDFLVFAQGTEPNFLYHELFRAPGEYTLDKSQPVKVTAGKVGGTPLPGALLLADLLDVEAEEYYVESGSISEILLSQLNAAGQGDIWLTPGQYEFRVASATEGYYLHHTIEIAEAGEPQLVNLVPKANEVASLRLLPDEDYVGMGIQLRDEQTRAFLGFDRVDTDKVLTLTPGTYSPIIDMIKPDPDNFREWYLELTTPAFSVEADKLHVIKSGGSLAAQIDNADRYPGFWPVNGEAYFNAGFYDKYGNKATYLSYRAASPAGLTQSAAEPASIVIKELAGGGITASNSSFDAETKPAGTKIMSFNPAKGSFEPMARGGTEVNPKVEIRNNAGDLLETRMAWFPYCGTYWYVGSSPVGTYQAIAKLEAGPYAHDGGAISSEPLLFKVQEGETLPPQEAGLKVTVLDYAGKPVTGARLSLMEKAGESYSPVYQWYDQITGETGEFVYNYFKPEAEGEYALGVYGIGRVNDDEAASEEAFFVFVPRISGEGSLSVTVNLQESPLHRLQIRARDEKGTAFDHKLDFSLSGQDSSGAAGEMWLAYSNAAELPIWVREGTYTAKAASRPEGAPSSFPQAQSGEVASYWGPPLYLLNEQVKVVANDPVDIPVNLGGSGLVSITPEIASSAKGDMAEYGVGGLALYQPGQVVSTPFSPQRTQPIYLQPGNYKANAVLVRMHHDSSVNSWRDVGIWDYWLERDISLAAGSGNTVWLLDDAFTASITTASDYQGGEILESTHSIEDGQGNRLVAMGLGIYLGWPWYGSYASMPVQTQNHEEVAPFLVIRSPEGQEIFRGKEAQPNLGMLRDWENGGQVRAFAPTTSFYKGGYHIPDQILGGQYKALLEMGIGPDELITAEKYFTISNDTAAPRLNNLPELTKQEKVTITGTAPPQAAVVISYRIGQGEPVAMEQIIAAENGSFSLEFTFPSQDGSYIFTARSTAGGISSGNSLPITILVDRTAPEMPGGFKGTSEDAAHIALSWDAASEEDISYFRLSRNGSVLADIPASSARSYLDKGLTADTEYVYTIVGVDRAGNISSPAEARIRTSQEVDKIPPAQPAMPSQVFYRPGGTADIYWQATTDNIGIDSYKIFRAVAGGEAQERGTVMAGQLLEFHDEGLMAETVYLYTIMAYDEAGNESEPSPAYELTTSPLAISNVGFRLASGGGRLDLSLVNPGAELTIKLSGEKSRQASADVKYLSLLDENNNLLQTPRLVTRTVNLTESLTLSGSYQGIFVVPGDATEITDIQGKLTDGAGHYAAPKAAANLPLQATGILRVEINCPDLTALESYQILVWSPSTQQGAAKKITPSDKIYEFANLIPADDYSIKIRNIYSHLKGNLEAVVVKAGQPNDIKITPVPQANLSVQVLDANGNGLSGVRVDFINKSTHNSSWVLAGEDGRAFCDLDVIEGETVKAQVCLIGEHKNLSYFNWEQDEFTLSAGENNVVINLRPLPKGTITGTITLDTSGEPLADIIVTAAQYVDGRSFTSTATSAADGKYIIDVLVGSATLSASSANSKYIMDEKKISISENTTLDLDLVLSTLGKADVSVTILSKYIDREETTIRGMDWWTAAHFGLRGIGSNGRTYGGYPLNLWGRPGDTIKVYINGAEAGLPVQEQSVVLDESRRGEAVFQLMEQGRIVGTIRDSNGNLIDTSNPYTVLAMELYSVQGNGRLSHSNYTRIGDDGVYQISVPEPGQYMLKFTYDPYYNPNYYYNNHMNQTASVGPITVNQYQIRDIGEVKLSYYDAGVSGSISSSPEEGSPNGLLNLRAEFSLDPAGQGITMKNTTLTLELPDGVQLVPDSIAVDGQQVSPSGLSPLKVDLGDLNLTGNDQKVVTCLLKLDDPLQAVQLIIPGSIDYANETMSLHKELVPAQVKVAKLTINAPALLVTPDTTLSGRGPAGAMMRVYDGTLLLGESQISPGGYWQLAVNLPDKGSPVTHRLYALTDWNETQLRSDEVEILFDPDEPVLTEIKLKQGNGREVTFKPADGIARFPYVIRPGDGGFYLTLKFNQPDRIRSVEVSISPFSKPAVRQPNGDYIAVIDFNRGFYALGGIYLKYETKENPALLKNPPPTVERLRNLLPLELSDLTYEVDPGEVAPPNDWPSTEQPLSGAVNFTLPRRADISGRVEMTAATGISNYVPTTADLLQAEETGIPVYGFKMSEPQISDGGKTFSAWVEGYIPQKYLDTAYPAMTAAGLDVVVHVGSKVSFTSGQAFNAADWSMNLKDGFGVPSKFDELAKMADQAAGCGSLSNMYREQVDHLANKLMGAEATKWTMMLVGTVLGPETFGVGTLLMFGASKAMEYALDKSLDKSINNLKQAMASDDECKNDEDNDDKNDDDNNNNDRDKKDPKKKKVADPKWIWDPSGNVYEVVEDNPLSGVKTTIYEQDSEGNMILWDAGWYGQENPLYTGENGYYGWDVPPGEWQVVYEKDGYERARSAVMTVPPPRTEVNVGLKSLIAPQVAGVTAVAGGSHVDISFDKYMLAASLSRGTISLSYDGEDGLEHVTGQVSGIDTIEDTQSTGVLLTRKARFTADTSLTVGDTYQVWISAAVQSYAGIPLGSNKTQAITIPAETPLVAEVSNPRAVAGNSAITITWIDPVDVNLDQIKLYWKPGGAAEYTGTKLVEKGVQTYTISGLSNGTEYQIKLSTIDNLSRESTGVVVTGKPSVADVNPPNSGNSSSSKANDRASEMTVQLEGRQQTVRGFNGDLLLNIPAAAFAPGIPLTIRLLDPTGQSAGQGLFFVSQIFEFNTGGNAPGKPLFITLRYNSELLRGIDLRQLGIYRQDDQNSGKWMYIGGILDLYNKQITAQINGFSRYAVMANQPAFKDLSAHWSQKEVEILATRGLIGGVGNGEFQPDRSITRAELTNILVKLAAYDPQSGIEIKASNTAPFTDVRPGVWYQAVVETAARLGLVSGSDGKFRPDDPVTREEMATLMLRSMGAERQSLAENSATMPFKDLQQISSWASEAVNSAWSMGLMQGVSGEYFQPRGTATRAQAAVVVLRVMERMGLVTSTSVVEGIVKISELEGRHFELINCAGGNTSYVLVPVSSEVSNQLEALADQNAQITGLLEQGVSQYMTGPVLKVIRAVKTSST